MQVFQSWADIVIMAVIAVAYIVTAIAQVRTIKAQKATIHALETQIGAAKTITDMQTSSFTTYKEMLRLEDINQHIDIQVSIKLKEAVNSVMADMAEDLAKDSKILERAAKIISDDLYKFCFANMKFMLYIFAYNNTSDEVIKRTVQMFFPQHAGVEKILLEEMAKLRANNSINISSPEKQIGQKKD